MKQTTKHLMENIDVKTAIDVGAGTTAIGAYLSYLPDVAVVLTIFWTLLRIYEFFEERFKRKRQGQ